MPLSKKLQELVDRISHNREKLLQWVLMAGAHEFRHAEQINRMKSQPGFPE